MNLNNKKEGYLKVLEKLDFLIEGSRNKRVFVFMNMLDFFFYNIKYCDCLRRYSGHPFRLVYLGHFRDRIN